MSPYVLEDAMNPDTLREVRSWPRGKVSILNPRGIDMPRDIMFEEHFGGTYAEVLDKDSGQWKQHGGCYPYNFALVPDPAPAGRAGQVLRIINRMRDDNRNCPNPWGRQQDDGSYRRRVEALPARLDVRPDYDENFWVERSARPQI